MITSNRGGRDMGENVLAASPAVLISLVEYQSGAVVSREIVKGKTGSINDAYHDPLVSGKKVF